MDAVELWCDGSGSVMPLPIGWAYVLVDKRTGAMKEGQGGGLEGTNNRGELWACIKGLEALKRPCDVTVLTDSEYVGKAYPHGWVDGWKRKKWRGVKNVDLWLRIDAFTKFHAIRFEWVAGHTGVPLNESCDLRAGECRKAIKAAKVEGRYDHLDFEIVDLPVGEQMELA